MFAGADRVAGGSQWSVRTNPASGDCKDHGTLFLLPVDRGRMHCALDVLVRHNGRGREGVRGVCSADRELAPWLPAILPFFRSFGLLIFVAGLNTLATPVECPCPSPKGIHGVVHDG